MPTSARLLRRNGKQKGELQAENSKGALKSFDFKAPKVSFVAKKDTSAYVNLMFYSFILRNILSTMCTVADIRWLCYTFNILLPRIQAIY